MGQEARELHETGVAAILRFIARFAPLDAEAEQLVRGSVTARRVGRNQLLTDPAELSGSGFFVVEGCVCSCTEFPDRQTIGDFFTEGEPVLLAPPDPAHAYSQSLRFVEDSVVMVTSAGETEHLVRQVPAFERTCRLYAEERLRWQLKLASHLKGLSPAARWVFLQRERPELIDRVPQHLLAVFLGVTPETLSRVKAAAAS